MTFGMPIVNILLLTVSSIHRVSPYQSNLMIVPSNAARLVTIFVVGGGMAGVKVGKMQRSE